MLKSKTARQRFIENLKRGDKIWFAYTSAYCLPPTLAEEVIFDGWFDFKGSKGKYCLLICDEGVVHFPKAKIFPSKKAASICAIPIVYQQLRKEIDSLNKTCSKLLDKYYKLLEIEF